jgi:amino acid adenylation domain-containing protein
VQRLDDCLRQAAAKWPHRPACIGEDGADLRYRSLADAAARMSDRLRTAGVRPGDRVGLCLPKSVGTVAALFGILSADAVYVPLDPLAPLQRNQYILADCGARMLLTSVGQAALFVQSAGIPADTLPTEDPSVVLLVFRRPTTSCSEWPEGLAYILYTSGSTGQPKGVMLRHDNALCFVEWAAREYRLGPDDVFSSLAPLHFDLSVFDLFCSVLSGGTLLLIDQATTRNPMLLAERLHRFGVTVCYATPTTLKLLLRFGKLPSCRWQGPRLVLFAGEVFQAAPLHRLQQIWSGAEYYNLYGPTETNVCTFFKVPVPVPADRSLPFPIGRPCPYAQCLLWDGLVAMPLRPGLQGELLVSGRSVMAGYVGSADLSQQRWVHHQARNWYRTGDQVVVDESGDLVFIGRLDRMVKRHGYRIELGEVEAGMLGHPVIGDACSVWVAGEAGKEGRIVVFYTTPAGEGPVSVLDLTVFLQDKLPAYMLPDQYVHLSEIPGTSTQKADYQQLARLAEALGKTLPA